MKRQGIIVLIGLLTFNILTSWGTIFAQEEITQKKAPLIPIKAFAHMPNATNVKISPSGKWLSFMREAKGKLHIYLQETNNPKNNILIPPSENYSIRQYEWVNNDWLIFSIKYKSYSYNLPINKTRLFSFDTNTKKIHTFIKPKYNLQFQDDVKDILRNDPFKIILSINWFGNGEQKLRKFDIRTGESSNLTPPIHSRWFANWKVDHKGNFRWVQKYNHRRKTRTDSKFLYFQSGKKKYKEYDSFRASNLEMLPHGFTDSLNEAVMHQTLGDGTSRYVLYDMDHDQIIKVLFQNEEYSVLGLIREPTMGGSINGKPIGIRFIKDKLETLLFDQFWKKLYATINKALPNYSNLIVSSTNDRSTLIVYSYNDTDPGVYYLWERNKNKFNELIQVNPEIDPTTLSPMLRIDYSARDGLNIPAYLTIPLGIESKKLPLVVMPHGGPHVRDSKSYDFFTQFLANRGYAVLQPNFRGSTGFRKDFEEAGKRKWGLEMQDDVTDGVQYLIDQGIADPNRVCIIGASYGGYAALMGAVKTPDLYKCAASINGVTHLPKMVSTDRKYSGGKFNTEHITDKTTPSGQLKVTSPALQAKKIKIPILLIHFEDDWNVLKSQAELMYEALLKNKKQVTFKMFKKGGHSMESHQARIEVLTELEKFLAEHLK